MKKLILFLFAITILSCAEKNEKVQVAEISCGQCQFDLKSQNGCDLAVRIDGKAYFVDGKDIDEFGDAHDKETGFCEVIRKGEIVGEIKEGHFVASSIKLTD